MYFLVPVGTGALGSLLGYGLVGFIIYKLIPVVCLLAVDIFFIGFAHSSFKHFFRVTLAFLGITAVLAAIVCGCLAGIGYVDNDHFFVSLLLAILIFLIGIGEFIILIYYFFFLFADDEKDGNDYLLSLWIVLFSIAFFILDIFPEDVWYISQLENSTLFTCAILTIPALLFAIFRHWDLSTCLGFDFTILSASFFKYFFYIRKDHLSFDFKEYALYMAISFGVLFIPKLIPAIINTVRQKRGY